jgi:type IV pilus assembly protein PilW
VEGIENMQVLYGEDANNDNTADYYVPSNSVVDMGKVVSIRVSLLTRTTEANLASQDYDITYNGATTTPTDRRLRRIYTSTISLRNRLP